MRRCQNGAVGRKRQLRGCAIVEDDVRLRPLSSTLYGDAVPVNAWQVGRKEVRGSLGGWPARADQKLGRSELSRKNTDSAEGLGSCRTEESGGGRFERAERRRARLPRAQGGRSGLLETNLNGTERDLLGFGRPEAESPGEFRSRARALLRTGLERVGDGLKETWVRTPLGIPGSLQWKGSAARGLHYRGQLGVAFWPPRHWEVRGGWSRLRRKAEGSL